MKVNKLFFYFRKLYLRYSSGYPKQFTETEILNEGKRIWEKYHQNNPTSQTLDCLWNFQSFVLKLSFGKQYAIQIYLKEYYEEVKKNFPEHSSAIEDQNYEAYKETIRLYRNAIN